MSLSFTKGVGESTFLGTDPSRLKKFQQKATYSTIYFGKYGLRFYIKKGKLCPWTENNKINEHIEFIARSARKKKE